MKLSIEQQPEEELCPPDIPAGASDLFDTTEAFKRFNACNDVFARAQWDPRIRSAKSMNWFYAMLGLNVKYKQTDGYTQLDYALRNGGWVFANLMMERSAHLNRHDGFLDDFREYMKPERKKIDAVSPELMSKRVKKAGLLYGADMVGVTHTDLRWHYSHKFDAQSLSQKPNELPEGLNHCIVIGTSMQYDLMETYPSALAGTAVGLGYSKDAFILQSLSQFIRNLGYRAVASLNDTSLAIPYAVQAGLAEYGRNGLAITKEFGPRVRFGKIYTDLPLAHDSPISIGIKEFCAICTKCADACPAKAIPFGQPTDKILNQSNIKGVRKWTVDGEKCFNIWANQGTECGICIRVCPFNKDNKSVKDRMYYSIFLLLVRTPFRRAALWMENLFQYGKRKTPTSWWANS